MRTWVFDTQIAVNHHLHSSGNLLHSTSYSGFSSVGVNLEHDLVSNYHTNAIVNHFSSQKAQNEVVTSAIYLYSK